MLMFITVDLKGKINRRCYKRDGMAWNAIHRAAKNPEKISFAALSDICMPTGPLSVIDGGVHIHNYEMTAEQSNTYKAKVKELGGGYS